MSNKPTDEVKQERVEIISDELIRAKTNREIVEEYSALWGVSRRTIYTYINDAKAYQSMIYAPEKKAEFYKAVKRLEQIMRKSAAAGDTKNAIAAQKELNQLLDLYQVGKDIAAQSGTPLTINIREVKPIQRKKGDGIEFK